MADITISKFTTQVLRQGSTPASPGFAVNEGQNPTDPSGNPQTHLPVTIAPAADGLSINDSQVLGGAGTTSQYLRGDGSLATFPALTGFVPYTGAVTTVDLGAQTIQAGSFVKAGGTSAQFLKADGSVDSTAYGTGSVTSVGLTMPSAFNVGSSPITTNGTLAVTGAGTTAQYVRGDGSLATFPGLTGFVPYTGATADVNLGTHDLTAERGTFENNGSSDTLTVNHTSGSGYGIEVNKGGNNEALYVNKTSGSGNAMSVVGGRTSLVDLSLSSVSNATGNFLTISGGVVHQRTPSETRSDVGAQAQLNGTGFVKASGTTITYDNSTYQVTSEKAQPNGYASLDSNGKVPLVQINDALIGNVNFQGLWNAATNTPTLANPPASGTKGYYYIVSTAGTFAGISFEVGDWIISNGTAWGKVDNTDAVSSVFGRTGNVTATNGDYNTSQVTELTNLYYTEARVSANTDVAANTAARHNAVTLGTANGLSLSTQVLSLALASGSTTGALSSTDWATFNNKENAITAGTTAQYFRGDKTFQTLNTGAVPESGNLYFTNARAIASVLTGYSSGAGTISAADTILSAIQKLNGNIGALVTGVSSVNGQTGVVVLTTTNIAEGTNLYYTEARVNANTNVAANTAARHAAVTLGVTNGLALTGQQLSLGLASAGVTGALSGTDWSTFNSKQNALNGTGFVKISGTTISYDNSTYLTTAAAASTYLALAGGTMTGNINWTANDVGLTWSRNTDGAAIKFISVGDGTGESYLQIGTSDNGNEAIVFTQTSLIRVQIDTDGLLKNGSSQKYVFENGGTWGIGITGNAGTVTNGVYTSRTITINGTTQDLSANRTYNVGTVTSVAALTLGTSGTDLSSSVANGTTTPVITLNVPTASAANRGALSAADWTTFNGKENAITAGTTAQYYRGDKTFQTLNTAAVPELTNLYYTEARVNANTNVAANTAARHNAVTLGTANGLSLSTQQLSLGLASSSANGALSSTDWATFNNKQNALTNPVTGTGTTNFLPKFTGASTIGNSIAYIQNNEFVVQGTTYGAINARSASGNANYLFFTENGVADRYLIGSPAGSGDLVFRSNSFDFSSGNERMRLTASGNLGLGVTPSAWRTIFNAFQVGYTGALYAIATGTAVEQVNLASNYFQDSAGNELRIQAGFATRYQQASGEHRWSTAASSSANSGISFTQAMTLGSNSGLSIGTPSAAPSQGLLVQGAATFNSSVTANYISSIISSSSNASPLILQNTSGWGISQITSISVKDGSDVVGAIGWKYDGVANVDMLFHSLYNGAYKTVSNVVMTVKGTGNVGIGTTIPDTKLQVAGTGPTGLSVRTDTSGDAFMRLYKDSTLNAHFYSDRANNKITIGSVESIPFTFDAAGIERMRIASGGDVGIGNWSTNVPQDRLHVNGAIQVGFVDALNQALRIFWNGSSSYGAIQTYSSSALALNPLGNNVLIGTTTDTGGARRLQVAGDVFVDDNTTTGNGVQLKNADRPLITRGWDAFTSGNKTGVGRWGVFMEAGELFLGSPGTDYTNGLVTIGGWLVDGTRQPNLTVNNQTQRVTIGTTSNLGGKFGIKSSGTNSAAFVIQRSANTNTLCSILETSNGDASMTLVSALGSADIQLLSNGPSTFRGGNVLIGTSSDSGDILRVNGNTYTNTITTQTPAATTKSVAWKLGTARGGTVTTNATVRVEIDGVLVDLVARYV
jgi:hypothetical protein